jgi:hypothetical protein
MRYARKNCKRNMFCKQPVVFSNRQNEAAGEAAIMTTKADDDKAIEDSSSMQISFGLIMVRWMRNELICMKA